MKAIVRHRFGGPEVLQIEEVPTPKAGPGEVLVRVRAFGLNRAEQYFRMGLWGDVAAISGIECVGEVAQDPSRELQAGQAVIALMGGMGRSIAGSYAEFVCVPRTSVVAVSSKLSWQDLASLPESYATAWSCLFDNLAITRGQVLVVRGATSALGQAAVNMASAAGITVVATVRTDKRLDFVRSLGAEWVLLEGPDLRAQLLEKFPGGVDAVLDLIGNSTVLDSLHMARRGGRVCMAGFLGGADPIENFNPLVHMPSGRHLSFFASAFVYGTPEYPLSDIPFQTIIDRADSGSYRSKPAHVFGFAQIQDAHRLMESNELRGKIVISVA